MKLRIEKAVYGGAGLARDEGKAIFVPFTLAGEVVEAHTVEDRGSYANAELDSVLEASPDRAAPPCPYFGECGGCHYQHTGYAEQVRLKIGILRETLERAHLRDIPEIELLQGEPLGYRNRIRLHVDQALSQLCYRRRGSHANLVVEECPIAAPVLQEAFRTARAWSAEWRLGEWAGEVELFTNAEQSEVLLTLWSGRTGREVNGRLQQLWPHLTGTIPQLVGAAVVGCGSGKHKDDVLAKAGEQSLMYGAAGAEYRVSQRSFFQVNRFLIDGLVDRVTAGRAGVLAWDLFAGVGLFARALASKFDRVVAVEAAASSVADLRHNLDARHRVVATGTLEFLRRARTERQTRPDFVVIDPPRAGLGKEIAGLLSQIGPNHITYVSCDPATLSRDLKWLLDSGYHLTDLTMVDLFPQTFHLESVAMISR
ncbi:MAG: 23S rRNA (uracil(1939)-C(5))-methyltransferase RlmD [Silvibacterium sp.]|nr:23S rRNA (uracil(1939)-C(5))-methyltransferase RlmD [Silvibacterium sp.]